jgi:NodT family efflux transporter outer membrane factor (OMF) lipoprotein
MKITILKSQHVTIFSLPFTRRGFNRNKSGKISLFQFISLLLTTGFLLSLAACAPVGPDYVTPADNNAMAWHTELGQGVSDKDIDPEQLANWWKTFGDSTLTSLIEQAVANNLDLKQATAKLREARARRDISKTELFPILDASGSAGRSKGSGSKPHNFFAIGFDAGWEVDIFGGVRRAQEAAEADLAAGSEELRDVLISLTAEVALNYLDVRTTQQRIATAEKNLVIQQETFDLISWRWKAGLNDELTLQQARYNLENTRAQIPILRISLEEAKNRMAVLTGKTPGSLHKLLEEARPIPVVPPVVAVGVPAETLRQRPDIRRAERNLAAQTARIGVATADLYPKFRLTGTIGLESLKSSELFKSASKNWSLGPGVSWNIFDAGAIRRNIEVQSAIQEQYLYAYEAALINGLEEVENGLTAYIEEQSHHERLAAAVDAARLAEQLANQQYDVGLVDFNTVLDAQRSLLSFEDQLTQSDGAVTSNLIRLYKALGGGWDSPEYQADPRTAGERTKDNE